MNKTLISRNRFFFLIFMTILVIGISVVILFSGERKQNNTFVILTFAINIVVSVYNLIISINKHPFSFDMMFWMFNVFFLSIAPLLQYFTDTYSWNLNPTEEEIINVNVLISIWCVCYLLGKKFSFKLSPNKKKWFQNDENHLRKNCNYKINSQVLSIFVTIVVLITIYNIYDIGILDLLLNSRTAMAADTKSLTLLRIQGFSNLILFVVVLSVIDTKQKQRITMKSIISIICLVISCSPLGIARNMLASFYGGVFIIMFEKTRKGRWFSLVALSGLVLVFPAIEILLNMTNISSIDLIFDAMRNAIRSTYLEAHYDAHQMIISIMQYVEKYGFTYFKQITSAMLFFVPRSIWSEKSYGTGQIVFEALEQHRFTNVSAPFVGEMYISFGVVFVVIVGFLLGKYIKKMDDFYWLEREKLSFIRIVYPFSMFMFFFMLRGDLMSSWAYTFAQVCVAFFVTKCTVRKRLK